MSWESHTPRAAWTVGPGALLGHGQQASGQQPLVPLSPPIHPADRPTTSASGNHPYRPQTAAPPSCCSGAAVWPGERGCSSPGEQASPGPVLSWQHKVRKGLPQRAPGQLLCPLGSPPTSSSCPSACSTQGISVQYARVLTPGHRCPVFLGCLQAAGDPALPSGISQAGSVVLPGPQGVLRFPSPPSPGRQGEGSRGQPEHHHGPLTWCLCACLPPETSIHSWALAGGGISASGRVKPVCLVRVQTCGWPLL